MHYLLTLFKTVSYLSNKEKLILIARLNEVNQKVWDQCCALTFYYVLE